MKYTSPILRSFSRTMSESKIKTGIAALSFPITQLRKFHRISWNGMLILSITNLSRGKRVITEFTVHFASISFPLTPTSAFCIRKRSRILARNFNAFLSNNNIFLLLFFFFSFRHDENKEALIHR